MLHINLLVSSFCEAQLNHVESENAPIQSDDPPIQSEDIELNITSDKVVALTIDKRVVITWWS